MSYDGEKLKVLANTLFLCYAGEPDTIPHTQVGGAR